MLYKYFFQRIIFIAALMLLYTAARADEFVVISFKHRSESTAARERVEIDVNDRKCALIIVKTDVDLSNAMFDANPMVCKSRKGAPGEWWVYVAPGSTKLQIKKEGFIPLNFYIPTGTTLESLNTYELRITNKEKNLMPEKEKLPEFVKIRTTPDGARVYLNGEYKGVTPFEMAMLEGLYTYKLEKEHYYTDEGDFKVEAGKPPVIEKTLKPRFGSVKVSSTPESGGVIWLDGAKTDYKTPYTLTEVGSGSHKVEVLLDMYEPTGQTVTVSDGQTTEATLSLKPVFGEVSITTNPAADIYIDKVKAGNANISNKRLVSGTHLLEAKKDKHTDATKTINVLTDTKESYTLEPKPKTGTLSVISTPTDAALYVDGVLKGQTPLFVRNLLIGDYTIQLKKSGYGTLSKEVEIKENQTTEVNESLTNGKEVTITTYPEGGKVKIDGGLEVSTPYKGTLVYGTHKIIGMPVTQGYKETPVDISIAPDGDNSFIIALISNNLNNTFTDPRDNKTYKTVKIGNQVWMAENLNYTGNNSYQRSITDKSQWESNMAYDGWCYYDNNSSNGSKYGVLYQWKAALKACPDGWHLPSDAEWTQFTDFVGGEINAGTKLKSKTGWRKNGNGTDDYGFTALPGGCRGSNGYFGSMGSDGNWWSSTEDFEDYPDSRDMSCNYANVGRSYYSKGCGFSVRCVRDL